MQIKSIQGRSRDILLLFFSILSLVVVAGRGIYLVITAIAPIKTLSTIDIVASLLNALGMFLCAALLAPLLKYCIRKLKGQTIPLVRFPLIKFWQVAAIFGVWFFMLIVGSILLSLPAYWGILAVPFLLPGIAMPVAGLVWIAIGGLPAASYRRLWAAFSIGMAGSTLGVLFLEYSLVGMAALAAGIVAAANPEWIAIFQHIKNQLTNTGDVQSLLTSLAVYLHNPLVLLLVLLFASFFAPIIEETLKPAAVWLLGKRLHSPAEGFALGALCGAGFALLEGTLAASGSIQMLGAGIAARAASSLMHITASGIMGWGIASARLENRYGRLAKAYFLSVSIHGMWNGSVILAVFGALRLTLPGASADLPGILLVFTGVAILGSMLITIMVLLPILNHRLGEKPPMQSDIIAAPQT
jgi:hypothetical protein